VEKPVGGVLLLHGLSDSPYSMREIGQGLHTKNLWVMGLRLPGHGTAPSGLLHTQSEDWQAAVRMAMRHLRKQVGSNKPLYIVGYSNGAALAVEYALARLKGEDLPSIERLVLLSPAIRVSPVAAYASWQQNLSWLTGLEKLAWTGIQLEIDPFKYNSFTVNASEQIYQLTTQITSSIRELSGPGGIKGFPPTIAFQSIVDATIPPEALIDIFFKALSKEGHELVLFDVNRASESAALMKVDPESLTNRHFSDGQLRFGLTLLTNAGPETRQLVEQHKPAGDISYSERPLELTWPRALFSLSHVALPFSPNDRVYGDKPDATDNMRDVTLGSISIRGERNLLQIPDSYFLRLRYNPFYSFMEKRIHTFLDLGEATATEVDTQH